MNDAFGRFERLVGSGAARRVAASHVAVAGLGGVGGHAAEALARCGVGEMTLIDGDAVQPSNINRQIVADTGTLGRMKAEVMAERVRRINPEIRIHVAARFIREENVYEFLSDDMRFVVDAIDDVRAKAALVAACRERNIPAVSSAGMAGRLDPARLRCEDIFRVQNDPLARKLRGELRKRGILSLDAVCSDETPMPFARDPETGKRIGGSAVFVTAAAGLLLAAHVIRRLAGEGGEPDAP